MENTKKKRITAIICFAVMAVITVALIIGNILCATYKNIITQFVCGFGLNENSQNTVAARERGNALAAQVEAEGAVLLKNNGALPLKTNKVNVFGWAGCDSGFIPQGTGSGTGSRNDLITFLGGLKEVGLSYNEKLAEAYEKLGYVRVKKSGGNYVIEASGEAEYKDIYGVYEAPESFYTDELMSHAKSYSDTAIVVLGRLLGEGNDYSQKQYVATGADSSDRKQQSISELEEYMLQVVCSSFDKVIVVLNTSNPMELGFVQNNDKIDSVLFMGLPGTRGTVGIGRILTGEVNPSGKVSDTWAYDLASAPSYVNSAREGVSTYKDIHPDESVGMRTNKYSDYAEDIYVGYKWYETADAEHYFDGVQNEYGKGYNGVVQYPFGFGKSYTTFEWTLTDCSHRDGETLQKGDVIKLELAVKNTGKTAGKDVVQVYYTPPYYNGGIEKSEVNLLAFHKTALLEPGKIETVKLEIPVEDMKSYDCYDRNNNGFMGYELEEGEYTVSLRTDAHTLAVTGNADGRNSYRFNVGRGGIRYEVDSVTGHKVENRFTTYTNTVSGAKSTVNEPLMKNGHSVDGGDEPVKITYLTRADFEGTFPKSRLKRDAGQKLIDDSYRVQIKQKDIDIDVKPSFGVDAGLQIEHVFGLEYDDPLWDALVGQLTMEQMCKLIVQGGFGTIEIKSLNKAETKAGDGPSGFNNQVTGQGNLKAVNYPSSTVLASTWDWYTAYQVGMAIGEEGTALGLTGWYGPGANLHRSPTGGRNFEYYSEDARLSGVMCAYHVLGAKKNGVTAYVKHIAVNDVESGRGAAYKWLTEQNLRENYLLPFEILVKKGGANAMMSSIDRVGAARASGSHAMLTQVLRDEWGFDGTVITDYYQCAKGALDINKGSAASDIMHDVDECVRAGNSMLLWTDSSLVAFDDRTSDTAKKAIFKSAKDILYTYADTLNYAETAQGLEKGSLIGDGVKVFPWWVPLLVALDVLVVGGFVVWTLCILGIIKIKKKSEKAPVKE